MSLDTATTPADAAADTAAAASFAALEAKLDYLSATDIELVREAYRFADAAHLGQMRHSGEPYITHPIAVAAQVAEWKLDAQALVAALLHDTMEDCGITKADVSERFGSAVAEMVDGLTKLDKLQFNTREEGQAESFRKMLLAMASDVRVILVKLADRIHNMRTMGDMPRSKWGRIATETLEIFVPIANRLGLNQAYRELQDLSFQYLNPWRHQVLAKAAERARKRRRELIDKLQQQLLDILAQAGLKARIIGREKTLYGIYCAMNDSRQSFAQVNDLYGMRLILPDPIACYTALGVLHQHFKPVPGRFKDYIAIPKTNGYQSLHTTLVGPSSLSVEVQIRTESMDMVAEAGVAAHWLYKFDKLKDQGNTPASDQLFQSLLDIQSETSDANEFLSNVKVDLFPDAVYVLTPKGQTLALPRGATVVDFAYAIHSSVGDQTVAARVNGDQVPLRTELSNGDMVEVITDPSATPNPAWLGFVHTGRARSRIRSHLKSLAQDQSSALGLTLLTQAVRAEGLPVLPGDDSTEDQALWEQLLAESGRRARNELLADIGLGKRSASALAKRLVALLAARGIRPDALLLTQARYSAHENLSQGAVIVDGATDVAVQYARCCCPIPGDGLLGYLDPNLGLVVHTDRCPVAHQLQRKDPERFVAVTWSDEPVRCFDVGVNVIVRNGQGVLARVTAAIASAEADIVHLGMTDEATEDALELRFMVAVRDSDHLAHVLRTLRPIPSVLRVGRAAQGVLI